MADATEHSEDFQYVVRIDTVDLNGERSAHLAVQGIPGIGPRMARTLLRISDLPLEKLLGDYTQEEIDKLTSYLSEVEDRVPTWMLNRRKDWDSGEDLHTMTQDLKMVKEDDIIRLKKIRSYRGIRHETKRKVRGQRTRSNGRGGLSLGVQRKKK